MGINIALEAIALYATWPLRVACLRLYLFTMLVWAVASHFMDHHSTEYFYAYWIFESIKFSMLGVLGTSLLIGKSPRSTKAFSLMWGIGLLMVVLGVTCYAWTNYKDKISYVTVLSFLCSEIFIAALAIKKNRVITIGALTGTLTTLICGLWPGYFGKTYPLAWILPLLIWISPIVSRGRHYDSIGDRERNATTKERGYSIKSRQSLNDSPARITQAAVSARYRKA